MFAVNNRRFIEDFSQNIKSDNHKWQANKKPQSCIYISFD